MNELDQLRAEVAELREATKLMFAMTTSVLAQSTDSAMALVGLMAEVGEATQLKAQGESFEDILLATLMSLSSAALKRHPHDPEVQAAYRGLRPGERH